MLTMEATWGRVRAGACMPALHARSCAQGAKGLTSMQPKMAFTFGPATLWISLRIMGVSSTTSCSTAAATPSSALCMHGAGSSVPGMSGEIFHRPSSVLFTAAGVRRWPCQQQCLLSAFLHHPPSPCIRLRQTQQGFHDASRLDTVGDVRLSSLTHLHEGGGASGEVLGKCPMQSV